MYKSPLFFDLTYIHVKLYYPRNKNEHEFSFKKERGFGGESKKPTLLRSDLYLSKTILLKK
ncbi:MAG: hypothetical protein FMNOHCHN_00501 [Ignavibacteriaceae bacterium]|nr:hypothetical protein [Ignavibacteriaceae bacterium]